MTHPHLLLVVCFTLLAGCGPTDNRGPLPDLPTLDTQTYLPAIRSQILSAEKRLRENPRDGRANGELGMILSAYGLSDSSRICFERAHSLDSTEFRWAYYLAITYVDLGLSDQAIDAFGAALAIEPDHPSAQLRLADLQRALDRRDESRRLYRRLTVLAPTMYQAQYGLGQLDYSDGELERAASHLRAALVINPKAAEVHYALAQVLRSQGKEHDSKYHFSRFERFKGARPEDPLVVEVAALNIGDSLHMSRAKYYVARGQFEAAANEFEAALRVNPNNSTAAIELIALFGRLGALDEARDHYERAVSLDPKNPQSHLYWGAIQKRTLEYLAAVAAYEQAVALDEHDAEAFSNLGFVLSKLGRDDEAFARYQRALNVDSTRRDAHYELGRLFAARGEPDEAIIQLLQAVEPEDDKSPLVLQALAEVYRRSGDDRSAAAALHRAHAIALSVLNVRAVTEIEADLATLSQGLSIETLTQLPVE